MKHITIKGIPVLILILLYSMNLSAQTGGTKHHATMPLDCKSCHSCDTPTYEKPCLTCCPEFTREGKVVTYSIDDAPDTVIIDILSNLYGPSHFPHRIHAEMAAMGGGCASCHHLNPPGDIVPCSECHSTDMKSCDAEKPSLKGAYHRQCLNCHRSWSNSTDCAKCHVFLKEGEDVSSLAAEVTEPISAPAKQVYQTEYEEAPLVTFYHDQHVSLYGFTCADCHQNDKCSRCHERDGKMESASEPHAQCMSCHEQAIEDQCAKCHDTKEKPPFDHSRTGFKLKHYHQNLDCRRCHRTSGTFGGLSKDCLKCHKNWTPDNFRHGVTGFMIDENHAEQECEACHKNRRYTAKPQCGDCHEDMTYPDSMPGRRTR